MSKVIGIDLGTTNSCVSVLDDGVPVVIKNTEGYSTTPSVVSFLESGRCLVGSKAKKIASSNVDRTFISAKRFMGSMKRKKIDGKKYSPQEISAIILMKLKKDAQDYLGEAVTDAVITVPAYYNDAQRQATKDAGRIAGLNVLRIINEPTAAALAYGLDNGKSQKILVYDLGGGTFDVSIIEIGDNVIQVLAASGDNNLGGIDFDKRIVDYVVDYYKRTENINLKKNPSIIQRLNEEAEGVKKELSCSYTAIMNTDFIKEIKPELKHSEIKITREKFNELIKDIVERTVIPVENALNDAGLNKSDIEKVLLVGGATRIPAVQDKIKELMDIEPSSSINPDECVAIGAAIKGAKLSGELKEDSVAAEMLLMDINPHSLSIETVGGIVSPLIEKNAIIPTRHSQIFTTAGNFQTSVDIKVYQGERKYAKDNELLAKFRLTGLKRSFAGTPKIEVVFDIDVNGIVNVSAKDLATGSKQSIIISSSSNMQEDEIIKAQIASEYYLGKKDIEKESGLLVSKSYSLMDRMSEYVDKEKKNLGKRKCRYIKEKQTELKKCILKHLGDKNNIQNIVDLQWLDCRIEKKLNEKLQDIEQDCYSFDIKKNENLPINAVQTKKILKKRNGN